MAILTETSALVIYDDATASNNPFQRHVDWRRTTAVVTVNNPLTEKYTIPPDSSKTIFSGTRTILTDGTSAFSIALNPTSTSLYRITNTGGTAPAFRTSRGLTLSGSTITIVVNNNASATFTVSGGGNFTGVVVGDQVFIPTLLTGDSAGPFNATNGGFWTVIAATSSVLTMVRLPGDSFEAAAEAVALTTNAQFIAFSSAGVQVGDTLEISAGFSVVTQKSFIVSAVTNSWVEFVSTEALPLEAGILPTASGMVFYSSAKRYVKIEVDQESVARFNGDTGNTCRLSPRVAGDRDGVGPFSKWGPTWSLVIVNRSRTSSLNVVIITAE